MLFPKLSSSAVIQYGSPVGLVWPAQVIRFIDGGDQRFLACGRALRRWLIDLTLLNESEIAALEAFVNGLSGEYSAFAFPDPVSATSIPNCRLGAPEFATEYQEVDIAASSFWVVETNG